MMRTGWRSSHLVLLLFAGIANAAAQTREGDIVVRAWLDRTAMWVADRVTYTIEITCRRGVEVLAEDLSRDKLAVEGLEVIGGDTERQSAAGDTTIYRFRYVVTTYRTDLPTLKIAPLSVRYAVRRAGQRPEEATAAGEVQVPGATIAFRSVLPDEQDPSGLRADSPPHARPMQFAVLQPLGLGLVIVSIAPVLLAAAALVRRRRRPRVRRPARAVRNAERVSLEALRAMEIDTIDGRRAAFTRLEVLVREHLRTMCGVPGTALTPPEVPFALASAGNKVPAELVASVLATCELARYAPPHAMPPADACRQAIERVDQILGTGG